MKPLCEHEFRRLPENERLAALHALSNALATAGLSDRALFDADADPIKVALAVRRHVPKAAELLNEDATAFYEALPRSRPLASLPELRRLNLEGCPPELDLSPLSELPHRIELHLSRNQQVLGLNTARSRLRIKRS